MRGLRIIAAVAAGLCADAATAADHPLDALASSEYWSVRETLRVAGKLSEKRRFAAIDLREPAKTDVLGWKPGAGFRREALAVLTEGTHTYEAVVDVAEGRLVSWNEVKGYASLVASEQAAVSELALSDPRMIAGFKKRGIEDLATVRCYGISPGYFATKEEEGRRLAMVRCWDRRGVYNADGRPIEGLLAWVDVAERKVLRVQDTVAAPVPSGPVDLGPEALGKPRDVPGPMRSEQPLGPGFRREGNVVRWQNWSFHFRLENRRGVVISLVRYDDGGRQRSILYQGSLSEIFVPYMDPAEGWYNSTFVDVGEYSSDGMLSALEAGGDCPSYATFVDGIAADELGQPRQRPRVTCLFEREAGAISWRHLTWIGSTIDSRAARELVLRSIANFGNYDYVFDWVFQQDGGLRVVVGSTGVVNNKAVPSRTAEAANGAQDGAYGRFVAEHTVATNHDHFFAFRLDLDVDGTKNSFVVDKLVTKRLPAASLRKSLWMVEPQTARTEKEAQRDMHEAGLWRFVNAGVKGPMGYPVSYQIRAGHSAASLLSDDDYPQKRAGFIRHALWVTPFAANELYAAGDYPTQSHGEDGLPAWTSANRPIENVDIVAWYVLGMHHVVRAEDWPVMPVVWHDFEIRPFDFFAKNPALDLPAR
jgi:primary-amine oxidase